MNAVSVLHEPWGIRSGRVLILCRHMMWASAYLIDARIRVKDRPEAFAYTVNHALGEWFDSHDGMGTTYCRAWVDA